MTLIGIPSLKYPINFPSSSKGGGGNAYTKKSKIWGIFKDKAGKQSAFTGKHLTHEINHTATVRVSTAPQEKGAFVSYSFTQNPNSVIVKVTKNGDKTQFLTECDKLVKAETLYFIVTPDAVYSNCKAQSMHVIRSIESIDLIEVDIEFVEVRIIDQTIVKKTTSVNAAKKIDTGQLTPKEPTDPFKRFF